MEIVRGLEQVGRTAALVSFRTLLPRIEILPFDAASGDLAGQIAARLRRRGQTIGPIDPMIAAIAIRGGLTLATGNTAHFSRVVGLGLALSIDDWRQP